MKPSSGAGADLAALEERAWEPVREHLDALLARGLERLASETAREPVRELHLELTHRCDLKCVMCEHWQIEHLDPESVRREVDFARLRSIVEGARVLGGIRTIVITGGEPWLRHDLVDIIAWLSERFPKASIVALTNFWNTGHLRRRLSELRARGVKNLKLGSSIDGFEATHDGIRGQRGAFAGLARTVKALRPEFPEYPFGFTMTIQPRNAGEIYRLYRYVSEELDASLGCQWVVETPGIEPVGWTPERKDLALRQLHEVVLDLCRRYGAAELLRSGETSDGGWLWSELLYWRYLEEYGRAPRRFDFFRRCTAGERHVMLDPEGKVFFCPVNRARTVGDATREPLDAIWSSPRAEEERAYVASGQCHCWLRCVSTPAVDRLLRLAADGAAPRR